MATMAINTDATREELLTRIQQLEAAQSKSAGDGFKVSVKGAVSLYGLQRFPITLYAESWFKLFDKIEALKLFIERNHASLSWKNGDPYVQQ